MLPTNRDARAVGAWYFALATAPFSLIYIPSKLVVPNDAAATASRILGHEMMFRLSILNEVFVAIVFVFLSLAAYRLLSGVNKIQAAAMVILGSVLSAPISFLAVVNDLAALAILHAPRYLSVFSKPQLEALALLFLRLHHYAVIMQQISWGVWLLPFGLLVMRSRFVPRILGILLIINGCAYIATTMAAVLAPDYANVVASIAMIPETGELWIALWLLIMGVRPQKTQPLVPALA